MRTAPTAPAGSHAACARCMPPFTCACISAAACSASREASAVRIARCSASERSIASACTTSAARRNRLNSLTSLRYVSYSFDVARRRHHRVVKRHVGARIGVVILRVERRAHRVEPVAQPRQLAGRRYSPPASGTPPLRAPRVPRKSRPLPPATPSARTRHGSSRSRTRPACSSARNASRTGPRDTCRRVAQSASLSLSPGASAPSMMCRSISSRTSVVSECLRTTSIGSTEAFAYIRSF